MTKSPTMVSKQSERATRILAIDSDRYSRNFLSQSLSDFGSLKLAESGPEIFEIANKSKPDLVIVALDESDLNGLFVCRWLKETRPDVCIILVTDAGSDSPLVAEFDMVDAHVKRPFNPLTLRSLLCQLLETQQRKLFDRDARKRNRNVQLQFAAAAMYTESMHSKDPTIAAMTMIAKLKDQGAAHLNRIKAFSRIIAEQLLETESYSDQIDRHFVQKLMVASQLHDMGNAVVGDELLAKTGSLSDAEYQTIKLHTTLGADLLKVTMQLAPECAELAMAERIARSHHEHWQGTGYPDGLSGDQIPLEARIVAVADVYDALTSNRLFRDSYSPELARNLIGSEAGKQFDPLIVEAFMLAFAHIEITRDAINQLYEIETAMLEQTQAGDQSTENLPTEVATVIDEQREKMRELNRKFCQKHLDLLGTLRSAFASGEREQIFQIATTLEQRADQWGLPSARQNASDLQTVLRRNGSIEQIGLQMQNLLVSIESV
jgi:putative two-component system response regulator